MVNCGKLDGTARIAPVIKWGYLYYRQMIYYLMLYAKRIPNSEKKYFNELIF